MFLYKSNPDVYLHLTKLFLFLIFYLYLKLTATRTESKKKPDQREQVYRTKNWPPSRSERAIRKIELPH